MYRLVRPLLFRMDAEWAHDLALRAAGAAGRSGRRLVRASLGFEDERLEGSIWGLAFRNPLSIAAGLDKNARLIPFWESLGLGFVEVGSVTARPRPGNPRPRAFRLPGDRALVNRMGLNNDGAEVIAARLGDVRVETRIPVGVNIAKTHDPQILGEAALDDFEAAYRLVAPVADYVVLNVSCPNTSEGKTFEEPGPLDDLLARIGTHRRTPVNPPLLVKLSPPQRESGMDALEEIVAVCRSHGVDGYVATNTASDREGLVTPPRRLEAIGRGGLSGAPLAERADAVIRKLYRLTEGSAPLIGVGGIDSADVAYRRIRSGASLLQIYTGLVYEGPGLVSHIKRGLVDRLERDGYMHLSDAVGADA